jgi:hypothetical protein
VIGHCQRKSVTKRLVKKIRDRLPNAPLYNGLSDKWQWAAWLEALPNEGQFLPADTRYTAYWVALLQHILNINSSSLCSRTARSCP